MDESKCPICSEEYDEVNRKAFILKCGHSSCSKCIKFYEDAKRVLFQCEKCCKMTESANIENKSLYKKSNGQASQIQRQPTKDEFEIYIRKKDKKGKFSILVNKNMTLKQLKEEIKRQEDIDSSTYDLCFKKPLKEDDSTLESYGIAKTVTLSMIAAFKGSI